MTTELKLYDKYNDSRTYDTFDTLHCLSKVMFEKYYWVKE